MAAELDRRHRPQRGTEEKGGAAEQLALRPPVDRLRVQQQSDPGQTDQQPDDLPGGARGAQSRQLEEPDPQRHRIHENRRPTGRDQRQGQVHEGDRGGHLHEADRQDDRDVAAVRTRQAAARHQHADYQGQPRDDSHHAVAERREIAKADLGDRPVDPPDEGQADQQQIRAESHVSRRTPVSG